MVVACLPVDADEDVDVGALVAVGAALAALGISVVERPSCREVIRSSKLSASLMREVVVLEGVAVAVALGFCASSSHSMSNSSKADIVIAVVWLLAD